MEKKRYILFGFSEFYPSGGLNDALCTFDEHEYFAVRHKHSGHDDLQILDTHTLKVTQGDRSLFPILPSTGDEDA
ncbi:hypothetical protein BACI349Y_560028 [Bacillus sp. 349Y]|nr:hypothetical protein BACI349Y_560028 [Bacillus sp. 349Y]